MKVDKQYREGNSESNRPLLLFDGVCNLCSATVQFVIRHEKDHLLMFTSLQSDHAKNLLNRFGIDTAKIDSVILIENGKAYIKSDAILVLSNHLRYPWKAMSWFSFIPSIIRNGIYDVIANYRYNMFGKKSSCWIPHKAIQSRFIDL